MLSIILREEINMTLITIDKLHLADVYVIFSYENRYTPLKLSVI